ncbi:MAG TPA: hypothetical protein VHQ43_07920 [Solirubrobacterales bacterium]|jgi:P pilus assembly chaperone PapD|nr:hypothetical protein [Solirubrobacterales bacterium]
MRVVGVLGRRKSRAHAFRAAALTAALSALALAATASASTAISGTTLTVIADGLDNVVSVTDPGGGN